MGHPAPFCRDLFVGAVDRILQYRRHPSFFGQYLAKDYCKRRHPLLADKAVTSNQFSTVLETSTRFLRGILDCWHMF